MFSLNPVPGALDLLVSSELLETVRQIGLGMASSDRTLVVSSSARALTVAEKKVARLAELGADVVMIMGAPPTMVRGHGADRVVADSLTNKYKIPVTVATIAQVDAFRAGDEEAGGHYLFSRRHESAVR